MQSTRPSDSQIPDSYGYRSIIRVTSVLALILLVSLSIQGAVTSMSPRISVDQVVVTSANFSDIGSGTEQVSIEVKNVGTEVVSLRGLVDIPNTSPLVFVPSSIRPGESATGITFLHSYVATFDGHSGYVNVRNSVRVNPSAFTLEISFMYNGYSPDQQMIFGKGSGNDNNSMYFYTFRSQGNVNDFVVYQGGVRRDYALGNAFSPMKWYTLSITVNPESVTAFVDGSRLQSWANSTSFTGNSQDLIIGKCSCGGYYFNGSIAFLRIYNRSLSGDEIVQNYRSPNPSHEGMALWLILNRTSANLVGDLSGNGNDGTVNGGVTFTSPLGSCASYTAVLNATSSDGRHHAFSQDVRIGC